MFLFLYSLITTTKQVAVKGLDAQVGSLSAKLKSANSEVDAKNAALRTLERKTVEVREIVFILYSLFNIENNCSIASHCLQQYSIKNIRLTV